MTDGFDRLLADVNDMMNRFGLLPDGYRLAWERVEAPKCPKVHALRPIVRTGALHCAQPLGHTDPHKDARGIAWPNDDDPNRCEEVGEGTDGHRARCWLPRGHKMRHTGRDVPDAPNQMFTWGEGS